MQTYLVFGLDKREAVVLTDTFAADSRREAILRARERLTRCHRVEVWAGAVCVHREDRAC